MSQTSETFDREIADGRRYGFGRNWARFLDLLTDERIDAARQSLTRLLGMETLEGKTFLDIGSGSGLFSLAARRLGATVTSFDYDPSSVECTRRLKERFHATDGRWTVMRGSVLDPSFMAGLGAHDVVYSWGVLHHTGRMYEAIANAQERVAPGGTIVLALYRKTWLCPLWRLEKRLYVSSPEWVQASMRRAYSGTVGVAHRLSHAGEPLRRGMDWEVDVHDWLGGYPYESITPEELRSTMGARGFVLVKQVIKGEGIRLVHGCDEYVFKRAR